MKFQSETKQKKVTEGYFSVLPFIVLYIMVSIFESLDDALVCDQMKAIEQYFHVVLFFVLYMF